MQRFALRLTIAVAVGMPASVISLAAMSDGQDRRESGRAPGAFSSLTSAEQKNPYRKLFQPRPADVRQLQSTPPSERRPQPALPPGSHEPQIDCKIRAILADPSIDRGIRQSKPSPDVKLAMRILEHPCLKQ